MLQALYDKVEEQGAKAPTIAVDYFPSVYELEEDTILGSFAWTGLHTKARRVQFSTAIRLGDYWTTPAEISRHYLAIKFKGRRLRANGKQWLEFQSHRSHPLYAEPCFMPDAVYIDLHAAYWTLVQILGFNVEYHPNRYIGKGDSMEDFPFYGHKLARNCLVSSGIASNARIWSISRASIYEQAFGRGLVNRGLWCCIHDCLNALALDIIQATDCAYVHTDGYIVSREMVPRALEIIAQWGLVGRIKKEGAIRIYGPGMYTLGNAPRSRIWNFETFVKLSCHVDRNWMRDKVSKLAAATDLIY